MQKFYHKQNKLLQDGQPFVAVRLVAAYGSSPAKTGAAMLVTPTGHFFGTVGGGKVEAKAIELAQKMMSENIQNKLIEWNLQKDIGMTCGGSVQLYFELNASSQFTIVVFGAGHVAQSLLASLAPIHCKVICIDSRQQWLSKITTDAEIRCIAKPETELANIPEESFVLCMTQGHSHDLPILISALKEYNFPYLGAIGSLSKKKILKDELLKQGISLEKIDNLHCPIGLKLGDHSPAEISISIVAQLLQERDKWKSANER